MALTRPKIWDLDTTIQYFKDPITTLHQGATTANVDVGFLFNRANGLVSNVALYWSETTSSFITAYTSSAGVTDSNVSITSYANIITGNIVASTVSASTIGNVGATHTGSTLTLTSYANIAGPLVVTNNTAVQAIQVAGTSTKGGAGYHDFLLVTNQGGGTNPSKTFRLNSTGSIEIINSAYSASIFSLSDAGQLTVPAISVGGSIGTSGQVLSSTGSGLQWIAAGGFTGGSVGSVTTFASNVVANSGTSSTGSTTGAIVVNGGIGVSGSVWAGQVYATNNGNGTNFAVGDDTWIGDINIANTMGIKGQQDPTQGYVVFGNANNTNYIGRNGSNPITVTGAFSITGNTAISSTMYAQGVYDNGTRVVSTSTGAGNLTISAGAINLPASGPGAVNVGSATSIPTIVTDAYGRVVSLTSNAVSTTISLAGTSGTGSVAGGGTLTLSGANGITTSVSTGTVTISATGTVPTSNVSLYDSFTATSTNATFYPRLLDKTSGNGSGYTATTLTHNPSTGNLSATGFVGTHYGSATGLTSIPAAQLTGSTLASGVTASSLTSVGTLTGLTVSGTASIAGYNVRTSSTINMSALSTSSFYPVVIPVDVGRTATRLRIQVDLNSNVPSWATHGAGFAINLDWSVNGSGWGTNTVSRVIHNYAESWASSVICGGITQFSNSSYEVVYLRGGGNYFFESDGSTNTVPFVVTTSTVYNSQTIAPISSALNVPYTAGTGYFGVGTLYGTATTAQYADLAENYRADADYEPGTVVVFGGLAEITTTSQDHDSRVAGVISTNPAYLMNAKLDGLPVAFTGRVPCRVQGPVTKGQVLVTSTQPGVAKSIDNSKFIPGCVVGKALEAINTNNIETIEVVVGRF